MLKIFSCRFLDGLLDLDLDIPPTPTLDDMEAEVGDVTEIVNRITSVVYNHVRQCVIIEKWAYGSCHTILKSPTFCRFSLCCYPCNVLMLLCHFRCLYPEHELLFSTMLCLYIQSDYGTLFSESELSFLLQGRRIISLLIIHKATSI